MGTRSLTAICKGDEEICVLYRQYDGYPSGHGRELAVFLSNMTIVNGIRGDETRRIANGANCLAAQIVSHFKEGDVGGFYLYPPGTRDMWEDYTYIVHASPDLPIRIEVPEVEFSGTPEELSEWIEENEG